MASKNGLLGEQAVADGVGMGIERAVARQRRALRVPLACLRHRRPRSFVNINTPLYVACQSPEWYYMRRYLFVPVQVAASFPLHMRRNDYGSFSAQDHTHHTAPQIVVRKAAPPRSAGTHPPDRYRSTRSRSCKLPVLSFVDDPVLAPMSATADQLEHATAKRMEGMRDAHLLARRTRMTCSR